MLQEVALDHLPPSPFLCFRLTASAFSSEGLARISHLCFFSSQLNCNLLVAKGHILCQSIYPQIYGTSGYEKFNEFSNPVDELDWISAPKVILNSLVTP